MLRLGLFFACLILWTVALFLPIPQRPLGNFDSGIPDLKFWFSKTLHVIAYAFLTAFAAFLPVSRRWRFGFIVLMSAHGFLTEFCQSAFTTRTGSLRDVLLDHLGIIIGLLLTFRLWRARPEQPTENR